MVRAYFVHVPAFHSGTCTQVRIVPVIRPTVSQSQARRHPSKLLHSCPISDYLRGDADKNQELYKGVRILAEREWQDIITVCVHHTYHKCFYATFLQANPGENIYIWTLEHRYILPHTRRAPVPNKQNEMARHVYNKHTLREKNQRNSYLRKVCE